MKKIFASLVLAAVTTAAYAQSFEGYEASPAPGAVTELSTIKVVFPGCAEIEVNSKDDINVSFNGNVVSDVTVKNPYGTNELQFQFAETATAAGSYVVNIPAWSISGYNEDYSGFADLESDINIEYTIASGSGMSFGYEADPNPGVVSSLEKIKLTFPDVFVKDVDASAVSVTVNGEPLSTESYSVAGSDVPEENHNVFVTFSPAIADGQVAVVFAPGAVKGGSGEQEGSNTEEIRLDYTVTAGVVYDLTLELSSPTKPNADGEISAEKQLDAFFFASDVADLVASVIAEDMNVTIRQIEGEFEKTAHLRKASGLDKNKTYFSAAFNSQPTVNGEYEIVINKGAFGDAAWSENPEVGHSNAELRFVFTLVDGIEASVYDIEPLSVTPAAGSIAAADLAKVTVKFPEGITAKGTAYATVAGVNVSYLETAELVAAEDGSYEAVFEVVPTELGEYIVNIFAGQFGDADYVSGKGGHGNADIEVEYKVDRLTGVSSIADEISDKSIYTVTGIRVNGDAKSLPAGIYVVGGKKVVVR